MPTPETPSFEGLSIGFIESGLMGWPMWNLK
jgi:hypothetical protein